MYRSNISEVTQGYLAPWRQHHGVDHPVQLLRIMKMLSVSDTLPAWMVDFAWYHDAILIPTSGESEVLSAELYAKHVGATLDTLKGKLVFPIRSMENTYEAILATSNPLLATNSPVFDICLDADAAILGAPQEEYLDYCFGIESEYLMYSEYKRSSGKLPTGRLSTRRDTLKAFLLERSRTVNDLLNFIEEGGRIFKTEIGSNLWEDSTLENLQKEAQLLSKRIRCLT